MGDLTRAELMAQAGLAAGTQQAQSFVRVWLDAWLKRTAKSWTWPMLKLRVTNIAIGTGVASVGVGIGYPTSYNAITDSLTLHVHRLLNGVVFWRSASGYSPNGRAFIRPLAGTNPLQDESITDPTTRKGGPATIKVRKSGDGALLLYPDPTPDRAMLFFMDVHYIPNSIGTLAASDTQVPWYPNDKTILQACKCALLEYSTSGEKSDLYDDESAKLGAMVVDDRDFDGEEAGDNQVMGLDPSIFIQS